VLNLYTTIFQTIWLSLALLLKCALATDSAHIYTCETTVFLNGKYSNTTYIYKNLTRVKKPRFSIKTPEPQIKQKNPRSSEKKTSSGNTVPNCDSCTTILFVT